MMKKVLIQFVAILLTSFQVPQLLLAAALLATTGCATGDLAHMIGKVEEGARDYNRQTSSTPRDREMHCRTYSNDGYTVETVCEEQ